MAFGKKPTRPAEPPPLPVRKLDPARMKELALRASVASPVSVTPAGTAVVAKGSTTPTYSHLTPAA